jgi:hypothetical protein
VNDDLVAVTSISATTVLGKSHVRQRGERLGAGRPASRTRFRGTAVLVPLVLLEPVASGLERAQKKRSVLGCEPSAHDQRPVLSPGVAEVGQCVQFIGLAGRDGAVRADGALELRGGQVARQLEQLLFALTIRDPRECPHLRVGELATRERCMDQRQFAQRLGHANVLASRSRAQRAAPGEPLRDRAAPEAAPPVELSHQLQPAASAGVDVRGEGRDLVFELVVGQVRPGRVLKFDNSHVGRLANTPDDTTACV